MDAVIVAAGNGKRLQGIAATGMKPLLVVNGETLISRLVRQAFNATCEQVIVVTSPLNAHAICDVVGSGPTYIVQPEAMGPGDALLRGLAAVRSERFLFLAGDNHMDEGDIQKCVDAGYAIGTRTLHDEDAARRFTRVGSEFAGKIWSEEGPDLQHTNIPPFTVWCGPLVLPTDACYNKLLMVRYTTAFNRGEVKIGPHLSDILYAEDAHLIEVNCRDIGVPEEVP